MKTVLQSKYEIREQENFEKIFVTKMQWKLCIKIEKLIDGNNNISKIILLTWVKEIGLSENMFWRYYGQRDKEKSNKYAHNDWQMLLRIKFVPWYVCILLISAL